MSVTVTLSATASASPGTPPTPVTVTSRFVPCSHGVENGPTWDEGRESNTRTGPEGWNRSPGITGYDDSDGGLCPTLFLAVTVNVYAVAFVRPATSQFNGPAVHTQVCPPGEAVTV